MKIDEGTNLLELSTAGAVDAALLRERNSEGHRGHLGMSQIGKEDDRALWLAFRWSLPDIIPPRVLRIFGLGHAIEAEIVRLLRLVPGVTLHADDGESQFRFSEVGGHFGGSMDGAVVGLPDAPKTWHVFEAKSSNAKQFKELLKVGLKAWRIEYWTQAQCYMGAAGLDRCLFVVYCKDDSALYMVRIKRDPMVYPAMIAKAERLIEATAPPASPWPNREFYKARFMSEPARAVYWSDELPPAANCRNCRFSRPLVEGEGARWQCNARDKLLTLAEQAAGCARHNWLPDLMPGVKGWNPYDEAGAVQYTADDGTEFWNVAGDEKPGAFPAFGSDELIHLARRGLTRETLADPFALQVREQFGARLVDPDAAL